MDRKKLKFPERHHYFFLTAVMEVLLVLLLLGQMRLYIFLQNVCSEKPLRFMLRQLEIDANLFFIFLFYVHEYAWARCARVHSH